MLTALIASALVAGCGADDDAASPSSDSEPLVTYSRSGGVAGITEKLVVERDGRARLSFGADGESRSFELSETDLEQLATELEAADFEAVDSPPEDVICADCFSYEIVYDGLETNLGDLDRRPQSVAAVLRRLGELAADHYPPGAGQIDSGA